MPLKESYLLPAAADFHVHLRDNDISKVVVPMIADGGVDTVYVMPNLVTPITTVAMALEYRERLRAISPDITFLMTLYLHPSITPEVVREAKEAGILGIKSYPNGLTTNSNDGVVLYEPFYPIFSAMQEVGMVLNIHGEAASDHQNNVTIMNAEDRFLPVLAKLHRMFPRLKIVMEHITTARACDMIRSCDGNVVGTITAHHMSLLVDDWAGNVFHYCKPVAKLPPDRQALLNAVVNSNGKFFFGTDSAPHDISAKKGKGNALPGIFTQAYACQYVLSALEEAIERGDIKEEVVTEDLLRGFLGEWGRRFYGVDNSTRKILLTKGNEKIMEAFKGPDVEIVPFKKGEITWSLRWQ